MLRPQGMTGIVAVDRDAMTVTALGRHPAEGAQRRARAARPVAAQHGRHRRADPGRRDLDRHPRHRRASPPGWPPRSPGSSWSPAPARCVDATPERERRRLRDRPGRPRRAGDPDHGDLRGRAAVPARGDEQPMSWDEALGSFDEMVGRQPPRRHVLVPPHRPAADQAQHPARRRRLRGRAALAGSAAGSTTSFLSNTVFGALTAGANRVPGVDPADEPGRRARRCQPRTYSDVAHRVFTSPRRVVFREMEYAVPREAGLEALREARRARRRVRLADQLPGGDPGGPRRRHPAVDGLRPRLLLPGLPHPPATPTGDHAAYFARDGGDHARPRRPARTGASCTPAPPPTWRRRTRASATSWRCATGSTPTGCSPTTTCGGCWATDRAPLDGAWRGRGAPSRARAARRALA